MSDDILRWKEKSEVDAVVCSPWFTVLDLAVPKLLEYNARVTCVHAPAHYVTNMPGPRRDWLASYTEQGLLVVLGLRDIGPLGRRCCWMMFFRSIKDRYALLKLDEGDLEQDGYSRISYYF